MHYISFNNDGGDPMDSKLTHLEGPGGLDYTLCGITLDGDTSTAGSYRQVYKSKLTCPECVKIVRLCRDMEIKI